MDRVHLFSSTTDLRKGFQSQIWMSQKPQIRNEHSWKKKTNSKTTQGTTQVKVKTQQYNDRSIGANMPDETGFSCLSFLSFSSFIHNTLERRFSRWWQSRNFANSHHCDFDNYCSYVACESDSEHCYSSSGHLDSNCKNVNSKGLNMWQKNEKMKHETKKFRKNIYFVNIINFFCLYNRTIFCAELSCNGELRDIKSEG